LERLFTIALVAAGPIGRNAEASGTASLKNVSAVYSYSKTRGLFAGVSLEGSVIIDRFDANKKMYGRKVSARDLLNGAIPPPPGAEALYQALEAKTQRQSYSGFGHMDNYGDSYRYDRNQDGDYDPYNRYDDTPNSRRSDYDYTDSPASRSMSFSRAAVRNMAKTGGMGIGGGGLSPNIRSAAGSRTTGSSVSSRRNDHSIEYDSPRQITASHSSNYESNSQALVLTNANNDLRARALFNFTGEQDGDLPFHKGDIITIVKKSDTQNDWWTGKIGSRQGIVSTYILCN
jgi:hypothetical protein